MRVLALTRRRLAWRSSTTVSPRTAASRRGRTSAWRNGSLQKHGLGRRRPGSLSRRARLLHGLRIGIATIQGFAFVGRYWACPRSGARRPRADPAVVSRRVMNVHSADLLRALPRERAGAFTPEAEEVERRRWASGDAGLGPRRFPPASRGDAPCAMSPSARAWRGSIVEPPLPAGRSAGSRGLRPGRRRARGIRPQREAA